MLNKLIMVGMRFQNHSAVSAARTYFVKNKELGVRLVPEQNTSGVDGWAIAVYNRGSRIGYIRNKDVSHFIKEDIDYYSYSVTMLYENYWVIKSEPIKAEPFNIHSTFLTGDFNPSHSPVTVNTPQINTQKEPKMNVSTSNMRDSFFREVKNVAIDIQSGKFGVVSNEGISVYAEGGISVNPIAELGVKIPAFALRVALKDLKEGDIVINGNESSFFKGLTENGYEVVNLSGEVKQVGSVTNMFFGKNSVLAVKNMFGEGTNPMMMALLMGDGGFGTGDNKKLMLAMAMSGGFGGGDAGGINPLMMMLMLDK